MTHELIGGMSRLGLSSIKKARRHRRASLVFNQPNLT